MKRTHYPVAAISIIVCAVFCGVVSVFFAAIILRKAPSVADLHIAWEREVKVGVSPLVNDLSSELAKKEKEKMLSLKVAPQDRDSHLAIVMSLLAIERNDPTGAAQLSAALEKLWRRQ